MSATLRADPRPLRRAGLLLGIGLGGFFDGIVFHQLLQMHNMMSARIPTDTLVGAKVNMFWDGAFHALVWAVTVAGVIALFRAGRAPERLWSGRFLAGGMLLGWGLFNLVEGVVDHIVLELHHVYEIHGLSAWDAGFLFWGAAMAAAGVAMMRGARPSVPSPRSTP